MNTRHAFSTSIAWMLLGIAAHASPPAHAPPSLPRPATPPSSTGVIARLIASAAPGGTVEIAPGIYNERLRIDRPVVLIGQPGAILDGQGSGDIVEISAPGVTLRGFTIRNTGDDLDSENVAVRVLAPDVLIEDNTIENALFGIDLREAPRAVIRRNRIGGKALDIARRGDPLRLWRADDSLVEHNTILQGRDAILWYSNRVRVLNNTVDSSRYGLHLMFCDDVRIEANTLRQNSVGIYLMYSAGVELRANHLDRNRGPSGYGIGLKETDRFNVQGNLITGNRVGVYIDGSPFTGAQPGRFSGNTFGGNDIGMTFLPSARNNEITENNFVDNLEQIRVAGRGDLSANRFWSGDRGNFWSDYTGYDQNADGVGDFVHESQTLFDSMLDTEPRLRLLMFSPAHQAVELVGRALPTVRPEPKFVDEVPLMRPLAFPQVPAPRRTPFGFAIVATALGGLAAALLFAARTPAFDHAPSPGGAA